MSEQIRSVLQRAEFKKLMMEGMATKNIAERLGLSLRRSQEIAADILKEARAALSAPLALHHTGPTAHTGEHGESNTHRVQPERVRLDDRPISRVSEESGSLRALVYSESRPSRFSDAARALRAAESRKRDRLADYKEKPISDEQQRVRYLESLLPDH